MSAATPRVAVLSVHTSPIDQPGTGDSGGMNVYIRAVAERLASQGVEVDLFTRCRGGVTHDVREIANGIRVVSVKAGPCLPIPKADVPRFLPEFLGGVLRVAHEDGRGYDIVHSHYWLSGWVGRAAKEEWQAPLVASFHTLGKVKNYSLARGEAPGAGGPARGRATGDRGGRPDPRAHAVRGGPAGRPLPGRPRAHPDRAARASITRCSSRATARPRGNGCTCRDSASPSTWGACSRTRAPTSPCARWPRRSRAIPMSPGNLVLAIVGGPSGADHGAEVTRLMELAHALGVSERVMLFPPQPQSKLADFYAAADVVLVPSRSESFGLVALEAQACATPVVAAEVGGLRYVVEDGKTGFLVEGHDPGDHADRLLQLLRDPALAASMGAEAARQALRFTWDATTMELLSVYREVLHSA